jgi:hypothetical protein
MSELHIIQKAHQRISEEQNATHAPTSKTHQAAPGTPHDNATMYEDRNVTIVLG